MEPQAAPYPFRAVLIILFMAVTTAFVISAVDLTLLLYLNHASYSLNNNELYIRAKTLAIVVPVVANPQLGNLSAKFGSGNTLSAGYLVVALGISLFTVFRSNVAVFFIGYLLYALLTVFRIVRVSIIAEVVAKENRTAVMAYHQLMAPLGAVLGPWLWVVLQSWRTEYSLWEERFILDRFSGYYLFSTVIVLVMATVGFKTLGGLSREVDAEGRPLIAQRDELEEVNHGYDSMERPRQDRNDPDREGIKFWYFCVLSLLVQTTVRLILVFFQPILVDVYGAGDEEVGRTYTALALMALIPPILVIVLAKVAKDRDLIVTGMVIKLMGVLLYLPWFGAVRKWQVVVGCVGCVKGSIFGQTAIFSKFTKRLGNNGSAQQLGYMWGICCASVAGVQIFFGLTLLGMFGSWGFGVVVMPALIGVGMLLHPWGWRLLGE